METRQTILVEPQGIKNAKKAGAQIIKLWITPVSHKAYEGRKRKPDHYLYGVKAICDTADLLCLKSKSEELFSKAFE